MIVQRGKVIDMLKGMAKSGEIPVDVQLIITQKLLDNGEELKPDKLDLEYEYCRATTTEERLRGLI